MCLQNSVCVLCMFLYKGFSSAEVNSTSLLQVVGYWLEDPISQEVGWPFSSFTLAALDKVNLATQADSVDAQQKFDCQTRAHDFIFWEWFFNASQIAEVYDEDHAVYVGVVEFA